MNFTRLILVLTISYLLFMVFSTNANARERLEDVTIQIMDINDDVDDFINRIELPAPSHEKMTAGKGETHVRPHVHADPADELRPHDHPREALIADEHLHEKLPPVEHTHEVTAAEIGTSTAKEAAQHDAKDEIAAGHTVEERATMSENSTEVRETAKKSRDHDEDLREAVAVEAKERREKAKEHAESRDDD